MKDQLIDSCYTEESSYVRVGVVVVLGRGY